MGIRIEPKAQLHPRHVREARQLRERRAIASRYRASARDLYPELRSRLLASRPVIGDQKPRRGADGITSPLLPVYGKPAFRNVIENGQHL